ncbi:MAG TPA: hypothetical protein VG602_02665, partial [Actinomycetota bacterium]|nr:hypothetical protein [Actinomycetota bacterium]
MPGVRGLFGEEGRAAVARFLEGRGWTVEEARPVQASYRPGRSCLVRFRARASGPPGRRVFSICAETRHRPPRMHPPDQETADRFDLAEPVEVVDPYLVWAFPYDPTLPRLGDAAWGAAVRERLGRTADRPTAVSVQPLRYRPRRRAVFRYR